MAVTKRSVSFDDEVAHEVEAAAQEEGVTFSGWLNRAARRALVIRAGLQGVREWEAENGVLTPEEQAKGDALLAQLTGTDPNQPLADEVRSWAQESLFIPEGHDHVDAS